VPTYPTYLPDGEDDFEVGLAALSRETVKSFLKIERPDSDSRRPASTLRNPAHHERRFRSKVNADSDGC
jgi:hypothetical protein